MILIIKKVSKAAELRLLIRRFEYKTASLTTFKPFSLMNTGHCPQLNSLCRKQAEMPSDCFQTHENSQTAQMTSARSLCSCLLPSTEHCTDFILGSWHVEACSVFDLSVRDMYLSYLPLLVNIVRN